MKIKDLGVNVKIDKQVKLNTDKQLRILKGTFLFIVPLTVFLFIFKSSIINSIIGLGITPNHDVLFFLYIIICVTILKFYVKKGDG